MSSSLPQVRGVGTQTILNFSGTNCSYEKWWADDVRIPRAKIARTEFEREKFNFSNMRSLSPLFPPCSPGLVDNAPPVTDIIIVVVKIYTYRGKRTFCVNNIRTKRIGGIASSRTGRFRDFDRSERIFARQVLDFYLSDNAPPHPVSLLSGTRPPRSVRPRFIETFMRFRDGDNENTSRATSARIRCRVTVAFSRFRIKPVGRGGVIDTEIFVEQKYPVPTNGQRGKGFR